MEFTQNSPGNGAHFFHRYHVILLLLHFHRSLYGGAGAWMVIIMMRVENLYRNR